VITIDFETRSECDITKCGAWVYSTHPSTEVLCMAWAVDDGEVQLWLPGDENPFDENDTSLGIHIEAHSAFFEKAIWQNIMTPRYNWFHYCQWFWHCSAAKAAAHSLPRALDKAGAALGLTIQKDQEGKRIMLKLCKPRKATKNNDAKWHEDPEDYKKLYQYCMDDVRAERALSNALRDLSESETKIWQLDQKINERGVRVDMEAVEAAIKLSGEYVDRENEKLSDLTNGEVKKASENSKLLKWIKKQGHSMESVTKEEVAATIMDPYIDLTLKLLLEYRQKLSKTSVAKYKSIQKAICNDGRLRDLLMYHGAHTGRWAGKIFQPHNLPQNKFTGNVEQYFEILKLKDLNTFELCYPEVMETISYLIRPLLIPSEGKLFFGGDYTAIEAMVLPWIAGDDATLDIFRGGGDLYIQLASEIYQKPAASITKGSVERKVGKQAILGLGYQMGADRFQRTCASYGIEITDEMAKHVVSTYRDNYKKIPEFWKNQELAAITAIKTGKFVRCGKIGWGIEGDFLYCKLPSKRVLAYYKPTLKETETPWGEPKMAMHYMHVNPVTKKWEETYTYGGKLTENIVQAIARDLLTHAMLELEDNGYDIILHIHDEIICEKEDGTVSEFEKLMSSKPDWAEGLPVDVEGWSGLRYLK